MRQMHNFKIQIISILTCGILTASNTAQGQNRPQEIKDFFNQLDGGFYVKQQILVLDSVQVVWRQIIAPSIKRKTKIAEQDIQYILYQMDSSAGKIWTREIFKKAKIISGQQIDRKAKKIGDVPTFYAFRLHVLLTTIVIV